jgi:hypothetical protein
MLRIHFVPSVYSPYGGSLPATDRRVRADFIRTFGAKHPRWGLRTLLRRYRAWVSQQTY